MTFYAIQIEECPGFGWQGGPEFDTLIRPLQSSGRNRRKARRAVVIHRYVIPYQNIPVAAYINIKRMHMAMWGSLHTFLHHDELDDTADNEQFGVGDGTTTVFQLKKTYDPGGGATYDWTITKPDVSGALGGGPVVIFIDGAPYAASVNALTGEVDFGSSPPDVGEVLTWSGMHYVCVRFNQDDLPFSIDNKSGHAFITNGSFGLIEELSE